MEMFYNSQLKNTKTKKPGYGITQFIATFLFGVLFLGIGLFIVSLFDVDDNWLKTEGQVVDIGRYRDDGSTSYSPIVAYTVNGQTYEVGSQVSSTAKPAIGESREVAYDPSQPSQAQLVESTGMKLLFAIFPATGGVMILWSFYTLIKSIRRRKTIDYLVQHGQKRQGVLIDILERRNSYRIVVAAADSSGHTQQYTSDPIRGLGSLAMADYRANPIPFDVYVDPVNVKNYYVDASSAPSLSASRIAELVQSAAQKNKYTSTSSR